MQQSAVAHVLDLNLGEECPIGPGLSAAAAVGDGAPGRYMLLPFRTDVLRHTLVQGLCRTKHSLCLNWWFSFVPSLS
eukprot:COSAG06_NODE_1660_length_8775_cov_6.138380_5_plen_77_part_00